MTIDERLKDLVMDLGELRLMAEVAGSLSREDRTKLRDAQRLVNQVRSRVFMAAPLAG